MKHVFSQLKYILTLRCDEASRLQSDELDRPLTRCERWALRMHEIICRNCYLFHKQLQMIRSAASGSGGEAQDSPGLSDSAKAKIQAEMEKEQKNL